jgi:hypothetical protein
MLTGKPATPYKETPPSDDTSFIKGFGMPMPPSIEKKIDRAGGQKKAVDDGLFAGIATYDGLFHRNSKVGQILTRLPTATCDPAQLLLRQLDLGVVGCQGRLFAQ